MLSLQPLYILNYKLCWIKKLSLKYQRLNPSVCKDKVFISDFVDLQELKIRKNALNNEAQIYSFQFYSSI